MEKFNKRKRTCPYSGEEFYPKRRNQRFAKPEYRVAYHNMLNTKKRLARAFIDGRLHKNYSIILELMNGETKRSFKKQYLYGKGFSFGVLTHYDEYDGKNVQALYDYAIIGDKEILTFIKIRK